MAVMSADQITIIDVTDAYSVMLSMDAVSLTGGEDSLGTAQTVTIYVSALMGAMKVTPRIGTIECPANVEATVGSAIDSVVPITVLFNAAVKRSGKLSIPVTVNNEVTITKEFAYSISFKGEGGTPGKDGKDGKDGVSPVVTKTGDTVTITDADGHTVTVKDGADGHSIKGDDGEDAYVHIAWANSADGSTDFSTTDSTNKLYMGTYTDHTLADSTKPSDYAWVKIKGDPGVSITGVTNYYLATNASSGVTRSTSGWTTGIQAITEAKQYLWNYEVTTGTGGTTISTTDPVIIGRYGKDGGSGSAGRGIAEITEYYCASASATAPADSEFSTSVQTTTAAKKYLWNYEKITYTSGNPETTAKRIIGTYGDKGEQGVSVTNVTSTNSTADGGTSVVTVTLSDGTTKTFNVKNGNKGNPGANGASSQWYYGNKCTHTSGTAKPATGISSAIVGDMYLNTDTYSVYRCTTAGASGTAVWTYAGNLVEGVIDGVEIGGRNLARGTASMMKGGGAWNTGTWRDSGASSTYNYPVSDSPVAGVDHGVLVTAKTAKAQYGIAQDHCPILSKHLTFSVWAKGTTGGTIKLQSVWWNGISTSTHNGVAATATGSWQRIEVTTDLTTSTVPGGECSIAYMYWVGQNVNDECIFIAPKLEYGDKATDWTPAPEDIASDINKVQENLDNLEVGGRNLLAFSELRYPFPLNDNGLTYTQEDDGWIRVKGTATNTAASITPLWMNDSTTTKFGPGTYTLTLEDPDGVFKSGKLNIQVFWNGTTGAKYYIGPGKKTFTNTVTSYIYRIYVYYNPGAKDTVCDGRFRLKLERGDKSTDWSPAPEDVAGNQNLLRPVPIYHNKANYQAYTLDLTENLKAGQTYTLQLWDVNVSHTGKTASELGIAVYWGGGSIRLLQWLGTSYFTNGHADHLTATFTVTESQASGSGASNAWLNVYNSVPSASGTMSLTIGRWKIEKGSIPTKWSISEEDAQKNIETAISANTTATTANNKATYHYGTCATAIGTAAKVVALSGFALYTGAQITVKFTNGNSAAAPTLNVNSTGAKAVIVNGATSALTGKMDFPAGTTCSFTYDGSHWQLTGTDNIENVMEWTDSGGLKVKAKSGSKSMVNVTASAVDIYDKNGKLGNRVNDSGMTVYKGGSKRAEFFDAVNLYASDGSTKIASFAGDGVSLHSTSLQDVGRFYVTSDTTEDGKTRTFGTLSLGSSENPVIKGYNYTGDAEDISALIMDVNGTEWDSKFTASLDFTGMEFQQDNVGKWSAGLQSGGFYVGGPNGGLMDVDSSGNGAFAGGLSVNGTISCDYDQITLANTSMKRGSILLYKIGRFVVYTATGDFVNLPAGGVTNWIPASKIPTRFKPITTFMSLGINNQKVTMYITVDNGIGFYNYGAAITQAMNGAFSGIYVSNI